ncbi:MAG: hypothetical protein R3F14_21200 [Polyangiaceae bacterium]
MDDRVKDYIVEVRLRDPRARKGLKELGNLIEYGASPRASIALALAARAHAFLRHRGYVTPEDVKAIGPRTSFATASSSPTRPRPKRSPRAARPPRLQRGRRGPLNAPGRLRSSFALRTHRNPSPGTQ